MIVLLFALLGVVCGGFGHHISSTWLEEETEHPVLMVRVCPDANVAEVEKEQSRRDAKKGKKKLSKIVGRFEGRNRGYAVSGLSRAEIKELRKTKGVCGVFADDIVRTASAYNWGIDRILSRRGLDGEYSVPLKPLDGRGVAIYVLDTGIDTTHCEFNCEGSSYAERDVTNVYSAWEDELPVNNDVDGHGTHVAALAGGCTVGVAAGAHIFGVKAFDDNGVSSGRRIVAALEWIQRDVALNEWPAVVVASFGTQKRCDEDNCVGNPMMVGVQDIVDAGIVVALAAGNSDDSACDYAPAAAGGIFPGAITVGAFRTKENPWVDERVEDSNTGVCVSIWAPGHSVKSAATGTGCEYYSSTGTSQAAPFAAGVAAQHLQAQPQRSPSDVEIMIRADAKSGYIDDLPSSSPNRLLQAAGTLYPTRLPTFRPTTIVPSVQPTIIVTATPTETPTAAPTAIPAASPTNATPTATPTAAPTATPTAMPAASPTNATPTAMPAASPTSADCFDDLAWHKKNDPSKDCVWVSSGPTRQRCMAKDDHAHFAFEKCHRSCGNCGLKCEDAPWHKDGDPDKDCYWAGRHTNRFNVVGAEKRAWEACRRTAGTCSIFNSTCGDDEAWFKRSDTSKDCEWVSRKPDTRCRVKSEKAQYAFEACKTACGACDRPCVDSSTWFKKNENFKNCAWVSRLANRRAVVGEDGTYAYASCPLASRACALL